MLVESKENYAIKNLTSFKIGGELERVYLPSTHKEFVFLLETLENPKIAGNWSNILVSSKGVKGDVISTTKLNKFEIKGTKIVSDAGVKGPYLSQAALGQSLSGFEFMIGFPGSIGGNVYMNAGAHGQTISDCLTSVCVFDLDKKEVLVFNKNDLKFSYRESLLQKMNCVILSAEFDLKRQPKEQIEALMQRNLEFRKTHQPLLSTPNAGSIFKNPENDSAGRLLDKAGVKEFAVGGAKVWEGHANFIVNTGNATSTDVLELMFKMHEAVKDKYTIDLHPEVRFMGEKSQREEEICNILYNQK
jgi:UDP-N-acetylmuramate dehydrogenase